jgi:D-tyrosyl-tRNA(Tyr) deacylase
VEGALKGKIDFGLIVYLGVAHEDGENDADWLAEKIANLRIFGDSEGKMNLSLLDLVNYKNIQVNESGQTPVLPSGNVGVLAVSQFTLLGDARKGRRPSWGRAAESGRARELYIRFMEKIREIGLLCEGGEFQAHMKVTYTNDGPVTILLDSRE